MPQSIRLADMWKSLSLQTRLSVLFCTMLVATFAVVLVALLVFSVGHLQHEREPAAQIAAQIADALNAELHAHPRTRGRWPALLRRLNEQPDGKPSLSRRDCPTRRPPPSAVPGAGLVRPADRRGDRARTPADRRDCPESCCSTQTTPPTSTRNGSPSSSYHSRRSSSARSPSQLRN